MAGAPNSPDSPYYLTDLISAYSQPSPTDTVSSASSDNISLRSTPSSNSLSSSSWASVSPPTSPPRTPPRPRRRAGVLRNVTLSPPGLWRASSTSSLSSSPAAARGLERRPTLNTPSSRRRAVVEAEDEDVFATGAGGSGKPDFRIQSESALRRAKMERLRRRLGECVPVSLVFPVVAEEDEGILDDEEEDMGSVVDAHVPAPELEFSLGASAENDAHLASVRVPFLWRKRLDVIPEHD
jgi:hypothetical protein